MRISCAGARCEQIVLHKCVLCVGVLSTTPSIFWSSFQETEITTIDQMMWNTMRSILFAIVSFATAMLKMKTLPTGFSVAV